MRERWWCQVGVVALVFVLWKYLPSDAVLTPAISSITGRLMEGGSVFFPVWVQRTGTLPWSHVKPVQHTWHSWVSIRSCPSPRLAANQGCWAQPTQGCVVVQKEPFYLSLSERATRQFIGNLTYMNFLPQGSLWMFRRVRDSIPRRPHGGILGRSQIWGQCPSPKPLGHRAT